MQEDSEEKIVYFDENENAWWYLNQTTETHHDFGPGYILPLPFESNALCSETNQTDFCYCIKCGKSLIIGVVCLFIELNLEWSARLLCFDCGPISAVRRIHVDPILSINHLLFDVMTPPEDNNICLACYHDACTSEQCKLILERKILYKNDIEELLEEFYVCRRNVNLVLINNELICHACGARFAKQYCSICYAFKSCSKNCAKTHKGCKPYLTIWREYIIK